MRWQQRFIRFHMPTEKSCLYPAQNCLLLHYSRRAPSRIAVCGAAAVTFSRTSTSLSYSSVWTEAANFVDGPTAESLVPQPALARCQLIEIAVGQCSNSSLLAYCHYSCASLLATFLFRSQSYRRNHRIVFRTAWM